MFGFLLRIIQWDQYSHLLPRHGAASRISSGKSLSAILTTAQAPVHSGYLSSRSPAWTGKYWVLANWVLGWVDPNARIRMSRERCEWGTWACIFHLCSHQGWPPWYHAISLMTECLRASVSLTVIKEVRAEPFHPLFQHWNAMGQTRFVDKTLNTAILFEAHLEYLPVSQLPSGSVYASKLKRRHEAIIQQNLEKEDSFNLDCLHQYPSRGDRSTPHLTMETKPREGSRANTDWDSETCKIHAHCKPFDDGGLYAGWEHHVLMSCSLICLTRLSWQWLPMALITQSEWEFSSRAANVCGGCTEVWSSNFFLCPAA